MTNFIKGFAALIVVGFVGLGLIYRPQQDIETRSDRVWLICLLVAGIGMLTFMWVGKGKLAKGLTTEERLAFNLQRVGSLLIVGFLLLSLQMVYNAIVIGPTIQKPFLDSNQELVQDPRKIEQESAIRRGRIFDTFANPVVTTEVVNGVVKRNYLNPYVNQLVGYYSPLRFGNSGLESKYDDYLSGKSGTNPLLTFQQQLLHQPQVGNDLYLTIVPGLQELAQKQLGNRSGAVVLLDANTGAVLAMVGNPNYNPADIVFDPTVDPAKYDEQTREIGKRWDALNNRADAPLLTRPTQGLYTPGSIFKTITLAAALDSGKVTPDQTWNDTGRLVVDGQVFNDPNRPDATRTTWTTREGYMFSLNSVFGQIGLAVGGDELAKYTQKYGFGQQIPFDLYTEASRTANDANFLKGRSAVASTGFGQGELLVTPLQMALVAASVARDDATMPKPFIVKEIRAQDKERTLVKATQPSTWLQPISPQSNATLRSIMIDSATKGYVGQNGGGLPGSGATVGGKTGTAEVGGGVQNAWYIAWAKKGNTSLAIAVVVDHQPGGEGLRLALPIANTVLREALK